MIKKIFLIFSLIMLGILSSFALRIQEAQAAVPVVEAGYSTDTTAGATDTTVSLTKPTGLVAGDLILVIFCDEQANVNDCPAITSPDAYTQITHGDNIADVQASIYWRIATGLETWPLVISGNTGDYAVGWCLRISGVDTSTPIHKTGSWIGVGLTGTGCTLTQVTTEVAECLGIFLIGLDGADMTPTTITTGPGWSITNGLEDPVDSTAGAAADWGQKNITAAGGSADIVLDFAGTGTDGYVGIQLAIAPPSGPPGITIASSTNQPSSVVRGNTDIVMGSVSIVRNVSSNTVTAVTLKENGGTIDAENELVNVELWLSSDTVWNSGDNRLESAKSFDGADGECTFTENFDVTTTLQYLIVRLDVLSSATTGHTIEVQVSTITTTDDVNGIPCDIVGISTVTLPSITVASSVNQPTHAAAGCTDRVMGVASIVRDGGTGQVTAVVLKDTGTIDAQSDLANIELWLSSDDTWDSGDEQLDTAKSFNGPNGECTFTETFDVYTSTQYLIVRLDVASGATSGDTIEVRISTVTTTDGVNGTPCDIDGTTTVTAEWWNASWSHRKELTFDNSAQTENLTYFPVMVKLTPSRINYSDFGKGDGTDLRFIDSDNSTELKYHIEEWNSSGDSFIWVNVPQIDGSSMSDFIYMYYGNAGATDVQSSTSTFSNNYRAVWHMDEDLWNGTSDEVKDSTVNGIHGAGGGNATTTDTGKIGRCGTFDGTGDYVDLGTDVLRYTVGTLTAWANFSDSALANMIVSVHEGIDTYDWSGLRIYLGNLQYYCRPGSGDPKLYFSSDETMTQGVWNYVAYVTDGSGNQLYINGEPADATYTNGDSSTNAFFGDIITNQNTKIGLIYDYNGAGAVTNQYSGTMDEVRFSTVRRSGDWIRAQYKSMNDTFITWPAFINVAPSAAQPSSVAQGCVDKVMGSVSIGKSVGSGTVTAVTLKENGGTIDAQNELSNIELWLSSDDTWDLGDNQLDTAKSFDGADGECTFNEGFVVTSSNQYLIVRLDVASGATLSDTVEIQVKSITTSDDVSGIPCDISDTSSVVAPSITVDECVSQPGYAVIPSIDNVMGVASIVKTGGTSQVTAVTLKENGGTIDAQNELENIELWLSSDTIRDAGDEQLSTAQSFNGADGECTFTETFDVTTIAKYLIVRLDVASGATSGDTIEIRISTITTTGSVSGIPLDFTGYTTTDNSGTLPDFTLTSSDISFSTHPHMQGQDITITAVILNDGANYASSIGVKFYDGDPDLSGSVYIDSGTISSLNSGTTAQVQITWTCTYGGDHDIFVHIDRENSIGEAKDNNNKAYKTITVGAANYWVSDTAGNWSDAGNWSLGAKPVQGGYIVFNDLYTGKCTIDENTPELGRIIIDFGAGEIEQNGNVTITGDFIQSEGKFTCSAPQTYSFSAGGDFSIPTISDAFRRATGSGTSASPYRIYDVYGLQALPCGSDSYFELGNNIDAGPSSNWDSGNGFAPMSFTGTFDGKNHTITGIYINRPSSNSQGLFSTITADATVKNLGLIDAEVHGANYTGSLASRCYGTIINCYSENGQVSGTGQGVGGLVGNASGSSASISKCYATGSVDGTDQEQVGGLVGSAEAGAYISNSYSHASVTGDWKVGGFTGGLDGFSGPTTVSKCYSTGEVTYTTDGGGFNGHAYEYPTIGYCFWDTQTSGQSTSHGGTGKTTAEMKQQATFVTWDFTSIWSIIQNQTYPYLQASGIVWDGGGGDNNWSTGANWVGDSVPGGTDNVVFNATSNKPCTVNTSATVANFSIVEGSTITITASANLTVTGNFSLSTGTFNAGSTELTIGGDWSLTTDSTFNAQTSTVTFNSLATAKLTGDTTFYCLVSTETFKTIKFSSNSITYVTEHLNLENVTLRSTLDGATWYLNLSGTQDVHDVDVQDSNASGDTINASNSTDSGNNTNWNFGPPAGANRYWVGVDNPDNWNDPNNWSDTSGETGGAGVPGTDDTAIFDGGNTNSCQIDISSTVASVIIYSTYTATISINSGKFLTTSGSFEIAGGTFTTNGEILDVGSYNQTGGVFNAGGSTVTCNGNFSVTVGTFNAGASVLVLDVTGGDGTFTGDGYTFNNVIFQSTGTVARTWTLGAGTITFNGNFQLKAQGSGNLTVTAVTNNPDLNILGSVDYTGTGTGTESLSMGDGTWTVGGNVDFADGTVDASTSTFVLNGTSTQTLTMDGSNLNILQITNSSSDGVYFADNLTLSTFTATTGNTRLYFCGGSTFTFTNIDFNGQSESSRIVLKSTSTGTAWYLTVTGTQSVSYVDVEDSDASGGNSIDADDGTNKDSGNNVNWDFETPGDRYWVASSAGNWKDPDNWSTSSGGAPPATVPSSANKAIFDGAGLRNCSIDIDASVTDVVIYSTYTATVSINTSQSLTTSSSFSIAGGTFTTNGEILDVGSYNQTGGIFNAGGSTVTCNGDFSVTVGTFNAGASVLVLDATDGNATFTGDGYTFNNVIFQSTGTAVRTWTLGGGTITINGDFQLKAQGSGNLTVTAVTNNPDLDIGGSVDYIGTGAGTESLSMGEGTWTVGGNVDFSGGTVDESTSTFVLNGTSTQTLTMDGNNLNILQITNSSSDGVYFADNLTLSTFTATTGDTNLYFCGGSTFTFTNIDFNGQSESSRIVLRSTSTNTAWYLTVTGNQSVSYVDVRDSNASGGNTILAIDGTSLNSGNNIKWDFGPPAAITDLTGQCDSGTGDVTLYWSTPGDDEWTGTLPSGSEYRIDYSTYSKSWNKDTYEVFISTSGVAPYIEVSRTITGLTGDSTYYFRIWTADEIPNWSGLSNGATIWVNPILSVSISTDTYNFGELNASTSAVSTANITVTNDGNIIETYSIKCSSSTKWTPNNTPGNDEFSLQSAFHPSEPNNDDIDWESDDILTESLQQCTTAAFSINNSQSGKNVPPFESNLRDFWLRIKTPLSTSTTTQQGIKVTISAEQGSP